MHLTFLQSSNVNKERFARKSEAVLPYQRINKNQSKQNYADKLNLFHIYTHLGFEHAIVVLCWNVCLPLSKRAQIQFLQKNY